MLRPFSARPPTTLAELSRLHQPARPACFATLALLKINSAWFPELVPAASQVMDYYAPSLPKASWRSRAPGTVAPAAAPETVAPGQPVPVGAPRVAPGVAGEAGPPRPASVTRVRIEDRGSG